MLSFEVYVLPSKKHKKLFKLRKWEFFRTGEKPEPLDESLANDESMDDTATEAEPVHKPLEHQLLQNKSTKEKDNNKENK